MSDNDLDVPHTSYLWTFFFLNFFEFPRKRKKERKD